MCVLGAAVACGASGVTHELTEDGAWCWYSSPRALYHDSMVFTGWVTRQGDIDAARFRMSDSTTAVTTLSPDLEPDDHNNPAFYATTDGRLTAFYAKHDSPGTTTLYRTSINPWSTGSWFGEHSTDVNTVGNRGTTYANPVAIPGYPDMIFLFWRGANLQPSYSIGSYSPEHVLWSWSRARTFIAADPERPYVRYAPVGNDRIAMAFTNGHPWETDAKLYFATFGEHKDGTFGYYRSDGSLIKLTYYGPLLPSEADVIYNGAQSPSETPTECWIWDVASDDSGRLAVAFVSFPSKTQHRYHWALCEDGHWTQRVLVEDAGGSVADTTIGWPQHHYSGGLALDRADVRTVYLSRENDVGGWDIEQWKTPGDGRTWAVTPITSDSPLENIRPVVPVGLPSGTEMVLWMSGEYDYYENGGPVGDDNYDTGIKLWVNESAADTETGIGAGGAEQEFVIRPCSPNPTRGPTAVEFIAPADAHVSLTVYDLSGRVVATLLKDAPVTRGTTSTFWDGTDAAGRSVASGVYFVRLSAGGHAATSKVVVLRE